MENSLQEYCLELEKLLDRECRSQRLNMKEFTLINKLLFELQTMGLYKLPEKFLDEL